jgi:dihydrodipicolinate synthase/N-acetylneuraminate lyase
MLTRETFVGPWAGLPVVWTKKNEFDEQAYRAIVQRCCQAGVPGVYTAGTTGEFYAMEFDEFKAVTRATVETCRAAKTPCMIGCTSTYTLGMQRRAAWAVELGADAVQVALPFWLEVPDAEVLPFFKDVASAIGSRIAFSIYETGRAKKKLTLDQHRAVKETAPNYLMVKANDGTVGVTPQGCQALSEFVNVFASEDRWATLGPLGLKGGCSAFVYWNPRYVLSLWNHLGRQDWPALAACCQDLQRMLDFLFTEFGPRGFPDSAWDRLGARACGFLDLPLECRKPYPSPTLADVEKLRAWYRQNFPQMLEL